MKCRICGTKCTTPSYEAPAPALSSMSTHLDVPTVFYVCITCGHGQSPDLPDTNLFYDTEYKISLETDEHDQLYEMLDGEPIYRTQKQAELVMQFVPPKEGAIILDYGSGKASSLRVLSDLCPSALPFVFDVSEDYKSIWSKWLNDDAQATYHVPKEWASKFDLVCSHFVLEHVTDPVHVLCEIAGLLKPDGKLFFTVPDVANNYGDAIVADHVSHFSLSSIHAALAAAKLVPVSIDRDAFRGAFVVVAERGSDDVADVSNSAKPSIQSDVAKLQEIGAFWQRSRKHLRAAAESRQGRKAAVYGASFYGLFIRTVLGQQYEVMGHFDRNPNISSGPFGSKVLSPHQIPDELETVYVGLNPRIAENIINSWLSETSRTDLDIVYLSDEKVR